MGKRLAMRIHRKARNSMRLYGLSLVEVMGVLAAPEATDTDLRNGRPRFYAQVRGTILRVVLSEDRSTILSVHWRRRLP